MNDSKKAENDPAATNQSGAIEEWGGIHRPGRASSGG